MDTDNTPHFLSITIFYQGELSAGIYSTYWTIDEVILSDEDEETREGFRSKITEAFEYMTGGGCYALYSDEGPAEERLEGDMEHE